MLSRITAAGLAAAILLALPGTAAARQNATPRIVGGVTAERAWPAQGYLQLKIGTTTSACGGSVVSGRWFLTAAHCATDNGGTALPATAFSVRLGSPNRTTGGTVFGVTDVDVHEDFDHVTLTNDIALLRLDAATSTAGASVQPLRLVAPGEADLWSPGILSAIIGWGTQCTECTSAPALLREAGVPITSDAECAAAYPPGWIFADTMLCAGNGISDTCSGDSGGPLMVARADAWVLAGVTSWGIDCADPDYPGVYARVGADGPGGLNAWIRDRMPTVAITSDALQTPPDVGSPVELLADSAPGGHDPGELDTTTWSVEDLDGHCTPDSDTGDATIVTPEQAGSCAVTVEQTYDDGDRAIAREVITTMGSTPPGPPDPAPIVSPPPPPVPPPPPPPPPVSPPPAVMFAPPPPVVAPLPVPKLAKLVSVASRIRVSSLLDRKLRIRVRCSTACFVSATLKLDARSSRKLRLTRRRGHSSRVAIGDAERLRAGIVRVTLRLSRRTIKRLRNARSGTLTLRVTATDDDGRRVKLSARIQLRR